MFPYAFSAATTFRRPLVEVEPQPERHSIPITITVLIRILG
jgi:hypothetical protein